MKREENSGKNRSESMEQLEEFVKELKQEKVMKQLEVIATVLTDLKFENLKEHIQLYNTDSPKVIISLLQYYEVYCSIHENNLLIREFLIKMVRKVMVEWVIEPPQEENFTLAINNAFHASCIARFLAHEMKKHASNAGKKCALSRDEIISCGVQKLLSPYLKKHEIKSEKQVRRSCLAKMVEMSQFIKEHLKGQYSLFCLQNFEFFSLVSRQGTLFLCTKWKQVPLFRSNVTIFLSK